MMNVKRFDPKAFLEHEGEGRKITNYRTGESIFKQGDAADSLMYLQAGRAKETVHDGGGKEAMVGILHATQFFGVAVQDGVEERLSTVTAISPCIVTAIKVTELKWLMREPRFALMFMAYLVHHNGVVEAEKVDLLFNSSAKRLARRLLLLARVGDGPAQVIGPEVTQEMFAEMIGTTRPRVNHFLNHFRERGFIRYRTGGPITVLPGLLRAVLEDKVLDIES